MPAALYKKLNISKNELEISIKDLYFNKLLSQSKIANYYGVNITCIEQYFKRLKIQGRSLSDAKLLNVPSILLSDYHKDIIEGWLLSDGNIEKMALSSRFTIGLKYKPPLLNLIDRLNPIIFTPIWQSKLTNCFHMKSHSYLELNEIYNKWYFSGSKQIPNGFIITPIKCYYWFIGDGYTQDYGVNLCTDSFNSNSIECLRNQLASVSIDTTWKKSNNRIHIRSKSLNIFYDFISDCIDSEYLYKWPKDRNGKSEKKYRWTKNN